MDTVGELRRHGHAILSELNKDPSKPIDWDVSVADLQRLVEILRATWVGSEESREEHPRVGTIFVDPDKRSLCLDIRFPLDFELLVGMMDKEVTVPRASVSGPP